MRKYILLLLIIPFLNIACKQLVQMKYKTNRPFKFKSKTAFFNYLKEKKKFEVENVVFLDKATHP
jgi:hypothetical protein